MVHLLDQSGPDAMGGAELQMYLLGIELCGRGWDVCYLVGDYGQNARSRDDGLRIEVAHETGQRGKLVGTLRALRAFWSALERVDADVYVTFGLTAQTGVTAAFARRHGKRSVFWFGKNSDAIYAVPLKSGLPVAERLPAWYGMRHASAVVAQTNQQLELLAKHSRRGGVMIRGVTPWDGSTRSRGQRGPILWVGSIQPKKRPEMLLDLAERLPEIEFVMAGGQMRGHDDLYERVTNRTEKIPNVNSLGFVPHAEIQQQFLAADMLVSTSDGSHEGFPNVFLEAWAAGLPVVAMCDPDGLITEYGLGAACDSLEEVVEQITRIRETPGIRAEIGKRAVRYIREHHSSESVGEKWENLLEDLLAAGSPDTASIQARIGE